MSTRDFSVIVPAHQAAQLLPDTLRALTASTLPRERWELLLVDDASTDTTSEVAAEWADSVITLRGKPLGPGGARNAAARHAVGKWLVFIDADVRVHPDTLQHIADAVARDPGLAALFGSYDATPAAPGFLSVYRNLLHRYVHLRGAGEAETFWAGCGAVRRDAFEEVDGFDTDRFPRPQIEDIDLGYRLRDRGGRILLDPTIQATHLKRWAFWPMVRTDFRDRGVPWMRLLLSRRGQRAASLNTGLGEQLRVALAACGGSAFFAGLVLRSAPLLWVAAASALMLIAANHETYRWFGRERGLLFATRVIPLHLLYYLSNALAAATGVLLHLISRSGSPEDSFRDRSAHHEAAPTRREASPGRVSYVATARSEGEAP